MQREEVRRFAKEVHSSVIRKAEETLGQIKDDCEAVAAGCKALEAEIANRDQEFATCKNKIITDSESTRLCLEKFREDLGTHDQMLAQHGEDLSLCEADLRKHEEQVD